MLAGLSHRAVGGGHNEDSAIHLGSAGDHVLHEVGVARAVDVSVVTLSGLVLDVGNVDGDTTLLLFRSGVDLVEVVSRVDVRVLFVQDLGDGCGQGSLTVIDVADGTNVNVRLSTLVLFLCHVFCPPGRLVVSLELTSRHLLHFTGFDGFVPLWSPNPVSATKY